MSSEQVQTTINDFFRKHPRSSVENVEDRRQENPATSVEEDSPSILEESATSVRDQAHSNSSDPKVRGKFRPEWQEDFPWARFDKTANKVFCKICEQAIAGHLIAQNSRAKRSLKTFTEVGWNDYSHGYSGLQRHSKSNIHESAAKAVEIDLHSRSGRSASLIDSKTRVKLQKNRNALEGIWDGLIFLAQRGLALRGHVDERSNFVQILTLLSRYNQDLKDWLDRKKDRLRTWTSPDIQQSMLRDTAHAILRNLLVDVKRAKHYSIIVDETSDVACVEQMSVSIRYVDENLHPHEVFLGLHECQRTDAASLKAVIESALLALGLDLDDCRGQAYDGASAMSGAFNGLQKRFMDDHPKMIYVYCNGHELNLVVKETLTFLEEGVHAMKVLDAIGKFLRNSPKKKAAFENFLAGLGENRGTSPRSAVRPLCPTRWTMDKPAIDAFLRNYEKILTFLCEIARDNEFVAKQRALASTHLRSIENFTVYFLLRIFQKVLDLVTPLHVQAQRRDLNIGEFRRLFEFLVATLSEHANDRPGAEAFIEVCKSEGRRLGLSEPEKPRGTKRSKTFHPSTISDDGNTDVDAYFYQIYTTVLEHTVKELLRRYSLRDMTSITHLETVLISTGGFTKYSKEEVQRSLEFIKGSYKSDINSHIDVELDNIRINLTAAQHRVSQVSDLRDYFVDKPEAIPWVRNLVVLTKIYFTLPCTTCECERSFSALRRIKDYLRSSMGQARLNHLMTIYVHGADSLRNDACPGKISLKKVMDEWVSQTQARNCMFAKSPTV